MGEILEAYLQVDIRRLLSFFFYEIIGLRQPLFRSQSSD